MNWINRLRLEFITQTPRSCLNVGVFYKQPKTYGFLDFIRSDDATSWIYITGFFSIPIKKYR